MPSKTRLVRSSLLVGWFTLLGSFTGILVDAGIAAKLGLSQSSDAFYVAYTVPYLITNLVSAGAQFSLVPFFAALEAKHSIEDLWRGFSFVINVIGLGFGLIAVLGAGLSAFLVRGIAPGFTHSQAEVATHLCRWLFVMIVPACLAEGFRSFLFSQHRFVMAASSGFFRNATVIAIIVLTFRRFGLYSIVLGYIAGYVLALLILGSQILISFPVRYSPTLTGSGQAFRTLRGSGSAQIGVSLLWQGVVVVERIIASFLPAGTITALNWGMKIISTLAEVLVGSIGTAALPALSRAVVRNDEAEERRTFQHALEIGLVLVSPAMVFCLMLAPNIVRLVFQRGNFTADAAAVMSAVLFYYSLSLLLYSFQRILTFYLFARQEAAVYVRLSALQYGLMVAFDLFYVGVMGMGAKGIPLAYFTALVLTMGAAYARNIAHLRQAFDRQLGFFAAKDFAGCLLAAVAVAALRASVRAPNTGFLNFLYLCELCGAGGLLYFAAMAVTRAVPISSLSSLWKRGEVS